MLGWTEGNWSGSKADIYGTDAYLEVRCEADDGFYRTAIGGAVGEANGKTISSVENGIFSLKTSLSGNGFMSGGDANKAVQIGGVVGRMPGVSSSTGKLIDIKKVSCSTEADFSDTTDLLDQISTDVGGVFGRGIYYNVEDCFSQIELTGNEILLITEILRDILIMIQFPAIGYTHTAFVIRTIFPVRMNTFLRKMVTE